jgi:hypothetical protein
VYQVRVAVTAGAQLGNRRPRNLTDESARRAHGDFQIVRIRIASVTVVAAKPVPRVDVGAEGFSRSLKIALQNGVALEAAVLGGNLQADHEKTGQQRFHRKYPRRENADR